MFSRLFHSGRSLRVQLWLWIALPATLALVALSFVELYAHERAMRQLVNERAQDRAQAIAALLDLQIVRLQEKLTDHVHSTQHGEAAPPIAFAGGVVRFGSDGRPLDVYDADWANEPGVLALIERILAGQHEMVTLDREPVMLILATESHDGTVWAAGQPVDTLFQAAIGHADHQGPPTGLALLSGDTPIGLVGQLEDHMRGVVGVAKVATTGWTVQAAQPWDDMFSPLLRIGGTVGAVVIIAASIAGLAA